MLDSLKTSDWAAELLALSGMADSTVECRVHGTKQVCACEGERICVPTRDCVIAKVSDLVIDRFEFRYRTHQVDAVESRTGAPDNHHRTAQTDRQIAGLRINDQLGSSVVHQARINDDSGRFPGKNCVHDLGAGITGGVQESKGESGPEEGDREWPTGKLFSDKACIDRLTSAPTTGLVDSESDTPGLDDELPGIFGNRTMEPGTSRGCDRHCDSMGKVLQHHPFFGKHDLRHCRNPFTTPSVSRRSRQILLVSSVGATRPGDRLPEYYAAKGALPSVTMSLAKHLSGTGITVNCVSPGIIATPEMIDRFTEQARRKGIATDWPSVEKMILETAMANPSGRVVFPDEVGRFVAFVVSEPAWHLNGAHLRFDGGAADSVT